MLRLQSAFARMAERVLTRAEPRHLTARGKVTSVTKNSGGGISLVEVTVDGVPYTQVRPNGEAGLALGATVDLDGTGEAGSSVDWAVKRVVESAAGGASTDPHGELSTPAIFNTEARVSIMPDGTVITTLDVVVELIAEQYRQRQRIFYEVVIRDANTGATLGEGRSIVLERVEGSLDANITSGDTSATVNQITGGAEFRFPFNKGIVQMGSELIKYGSVLTVSPTEVTLASLSRAYDGTSAAGHTAGDRVTLRGLSITKDVATVEEYEITVRAINATDGRVSNWSDAFNYEHEGDTTAPTWGGGANVVVTNVDGGLQVSWDAVDTDAKDLGYYEIRHSPDGSSWTSEKVGNGTNWKYGGAVGDIRFFQVRAVDNTGNVSSWSSSARGGTLPPNEPSGTNLITNGTLDSNTNNWTFQTLGTGSKNHDTSVYHRGGGSMRLDESRDGAFQLSLEVVSDAFTVTAANEFTARVMLRQSGYTDAQDEIQLTIRNASTNFDYAKLVLVGSQVASGTGEWTAVNLRGYVPSGVTSLEMFIGGTIDIGAGATSLWIDEVEVLQPTALTVFSPTRLQVGGGAAVSQILTATASLNFGSIAQDNDAELTITVTGAASGDTAIVTPTSGIEADLAWCGFVSAADTVTVRLINNSAGSIDPGARTWRATVIKF